MIKKTVLSLCVILLSLTAVIASPVDGKWKATVEGPEGEMELQYVFKSDGEKLTGSLVTPMGELEIQNGKINGNEFSFDLDMMGNVMPVKGKVVGDKLELTMEGVPGDGKTILEKVE